MSIHLKENFFIINHEITILSFFIYSVCDEKVNRTEKLECIFLINQKSVTKNKIM